MSNFKLSGAVASLGLLFLAGCNKDDMDADAKAYVEKSCLSATMVAGVEPGSPGFDEKMSASVKIGTEAMAIAKENGRKYQGNFSEYMALIGKYMEDRTLCPNVVR